MVWKATRTLLKMHSCTNPVRMHKKFIGQMGLPKDPNIPKCSKFIEKDLITHLVKAMMNAVHIMLGLYWKTLKR